MPTPPRSSFGAACARDSLSTKEALTMVRIPIGRLIRKIGRQPIWKKLAWIINPPSNWPTIEPKPIMAPYRLKATRFDEPLKLT